MSAITRRRYLAEPVLPVTDDFREALLAYCDQERGRKIALARQCGIDHTTVTSLLSGRVKNSTAVGLICRAIGLPLPGTANGEDPEIEAAICVIRAKDAAAFRRWRSETLRLARQLDPDGE